MIEVVTEAGTTFRIEDTILMENLGTEALCKAAKTIQITLQLAHTKVSTPTCSTEEKEGTIKAVVDTIDTAVAETALTTVTEASTSSVKLKNSTAQTNSLTIHTHLKEIQNLN